MHKKLDCLSGARQTPGDGGDNVVPLPLLVHQVLDLLGPLPPSALLVVPPLEVDDLVGLPQWITFEFGRFFL